MNVTSRQFRSRFILLGLALSTLAALLLGVLPSEKVMRQWFQASGYSFILVTFLLWCEAHLPKSDAWVHLRAAWQQHRWALALASLLTVCAVMTSPPKFRVLADETNLLGMAQAMYDERQFHNPTEGKFYYEKFQKTNLAWGKRPLFYPFLVSVTHTLTGYRATNGFVVSILSGFASLLAFYWLLRRLFTNELALFGMASMAAFPVLTLWMTSSGFESLYVLFAILAFLGLDYFLLTRDSAHLERLGLTLVLLAQIRYESALFALCFAPIVLLTMRRPQYTTLTWRCLPLPLLFLPVIWQRLLKTKDLIFELPNNVDAFSLENFINNLPHAWRYFTNAQDWYGTIPLIFYTALFAGGCGLVSLVGRHKNMSRRALGMAVALILVVGLQSVILFFYYYGDLTQGYTIRFGIIYVPVLVFLWVLFLSWVTAQGRRGKRYLAVGALALILYYWPIAGHNEAVRQRFVYREYQQTLAFLQKHYPEENILIVSDRPNLYTPHRWGAMSFPYARSHAKTLKKELKRHLFQEILVIQHVQYEDDHPRVPERLNEEYQLETLFETQHTAHQYIRISRVVPPQ